MPVPKRKRSKARRDKRFANKGVSILSITQCLNCKAPLNTHVACGECGFYKGIKVMNTKADRIVVRAIERQSKQAKEKPAAEQAS